MLSPESRLWVYSLIKNPSESLKSFFDSTNKGSKPFILSNNKPAIRTRRKTIRNTAKLALKDLELLAYGLGVKDHKEIFNLDNFKPLFDALNYYAKTREEDKGYVKNVRMFKFFAEISKLCLNNCRTLFSKEFEDLNEMEKDRSVGMPSREDLKYIQIAYNTIFLNEEKTSR